MKNCDFEAINDEIRKRNTLLKPVVFVLFGLLAFVVAATRVLGDSLDYFGCDEFFGFFI
jgi:hypothetical protein